MDIKGNNLHELAEEFHYLYSKEAYDFLITGCTMSDNWGVIKKEGLDNELHNVFRDMSEQEMIHCYLFTRAGDVDYKNFAFARIDGEQLAPDGELKKLAKLVRRMFTGLYPDMVPLYADTDEQFLQKLDEAQKEGNVFNEWTVQEHTTSAWFYNKLPSEDYREVIFSSKHGSELKNTYSCTFSIYKQGSGEWPIPTIAIK